MTFIYKKEHSTSVLAEQTRMLFSATTLSSIATTANGGLLLIALWDIVNHVHLTIWFVCLSCITAGRIALHRAYTKTEIEAKQIYQWTNRFSIGVVLIATAWAAAPIFLFPTTSIEHQVFLAFVLAGLCAGAVTTLSFLKTTVLIYLSFCLIPIGIQFIRSGSDISLFMGVLTIFFFLITATSALRIYNNTNENILVRFKSVENENALRESEARFRSIFDSASLGIVHYDQHDIIRSYNPAFSKITHYDDSIQGKYVRQVFTEPEAIRVMQATHSGREGIFTGEIRFLGKNNPVPVRVHFRGITETTGTPMGGVAIVEDLTEDMRVEKLKNEFVSTVSHELRTPLTAIKGSLDLLSMDNIKQQPQMVDELLSNARRNSDRLLNLINDILDIDKIKQGKLEYKIERTELMPLIEQTISANEPFAQQHDIHFSICNRLDDIYIDVDGLRLQQVLTNLLSNAAKFSETSSSVEVSLEEHGDNEISIAVKDYGCGIPEEFHDRIFTKFSQHDGSDIRKVGGTGLGLNISKAIVEHHHGRLEFDSTQGEGSTFYVILPIAKL